MRGTSGQSSRHGTAVDGAATAATARSQGSGGDSQGSLPPSGPRSPRASERRFHDVSASLSHLQELDTASASLKSRRFDLPEGDASSAPPRQSVSRSLTAAASGTSPPEFAAASSTVIRGVYLDPARTSNEFDLDEAVEHAAARDLHADVVRASVRRLGQSALLNVALLATLIAVGGLATMPVEKSLGEHYARSLPALLAAVVLNLGLFAVTRLNHAAPRAVVTIGQLHLVLYCLALSIFRHSHPWPLDEMLRSWSPAAVAIVLFGALIPLRPSRVLAWGLVAAATDPLTAALTGAAGGSVTSLVLLSLSPLVAAGIAYFSSTLTYDLGARVTRARRVGSYTLVERLGGGAMGEVWRAEHRMLARGAAIKLIRPEALRVDDQAEARRVVRLFELEAQATTMLSSPHTISVYDFGVTVEGHFYYAMELLDGFDLQKLVERHGPQPPARVARILAQVAESLSEAHSHRYVHRDLKPANVFLCRHGGRVDFVKVLDFGLVLDTSDDDGPPGAGRSEAKGAPVGTPSIMAPEMLVAGAPVDHRSDIYAFGCLGYWLLTGKRVFPAKTRAEMRRMHASVAPEPPSHRSGRPVPSLLEEMVMKCLEKNPAARPQSALRLADELQASGLFEGWSRDAALTFWERHACGQLSSRLGA